MHFPSKEFSDAPRRSRKPGYRGPIGEAGRLGGGIVAAGLVSVTPWVFGGVQASVQPWLLIAVASGLVFCLAQVVLGSDAYGAAALATMPLVCGLGLAGLQLVPLPGRTLEWVSPKAAELRAELEASKPSGDALLAERLAIPPNPDRHPVSLYPAATRRELALLAMAIGMFVIGAVCFSAPRAQWWLLILIAVNGTVLVLLGLAQALTWNGRIYWQVPLSEGGGPFGPFVNRNNAAGFLNLCLAGALGWTLCAFSYPGLAKPHVHEQNHSARGRRWLASWADPVRGFFAGLNATRLASLLIVVWIAGGVLCTISRGAWIALASAALATALFILGATRRIVWTWLAGILVAGAMGLVAWSGMWKRFTDQLATLLDENILTHNLLPLWRDCVQAVGDFWQTGTGLGTFRYVYGLYQQRPVEAWFHYAENQYLQALIEAGAIGLGLMVLMIGVVGWSSWRIVKRDADPRARAFAVAGFFALATQVVHAAFDFGLSIPSNSLLFALLCGAMVGRAFTGRSLAPSRLSKPGSLGQVFAAAVVVLLVGTNTWAVTELSKAAEVDTALRQARYRNAGPELSEQQIAEAIDRLTAAVGVRADDAEGHQHLARLWIHKYRKRTFHNLLSADASADDFKQAWALTLPVVLQGRFHQMAQAERGKDLEYLRSEPGIQECLIPAMRHFIWARRHCPLLFSAHLGIAELCGIVVEPGEDGVSLNRAQRVAPANPELLFEVGLAHVNAGRREAACESFRRSLVLSEKRLSDIVEIAEQRLSLLELVEWILPDSPKLLLDMARHRRFAGPQYRDLRCRLAQRALGALERNSYSEDERCYWRAVALAVQEKYPEAVAESERAVRMRPRETAWRYQLALLLRRQGSLEEAHEHARLCAILDPSRREYRTLLEEVNLARLATGTYAEGRRK